MKVFVFVEGPADKLALEELWGPWRERLRAQGMGIAIIPLDNKSRYLKKIGAHAAEKLAANTVDLAVGLPDLHPVDGYRGTEFDHKDHASLAELQARLVNRQLRDTFGFSTAQVSIRMQCFYASSLKHDLEMLLLAAHERLQTALKGNVNRDRWRHPVEDQNLQHPPKRIVEELYRTRLRRAYLDTVHAPPVLRQAAGDIRSLLFSHHGQLECPVFKAMLDWVGEKTGVLAYV